MFEKLTDTVWLLIAFIFIFNIAAWFMLKWFLNRSTYKAFLKPRSEAALTAEEREKKDFSGIIRSVHKTHEGNYLFLENDKLNAFLFDHELPLEQGKELKIRCEKIGALYGNITQWRIMTFEIK